MSDTTTTTDTADTAADEQRQESPTPAGSEKPTDDSPLGDGGTRALKAERQARRAAEKQLNELQAKIQQFEDRDKTELERLQEQAQAARDQAAKAESELLRLRVAAESGLPADLHEFLTGDTEEELRQRADKLLAATAAAQGDRPRSPAPDPTQGAKPKQSGPDQLTRADLARMSPAEIEEARAAGRLADILAGRA